MYVQMPSNTLKCSSCYKYSRFCVCSSLILCPDLTRLGLTLKEARDWTNDGEMQMIYSYHLLLLMMMMMRIDDDDDDDDDGDDECFVMTHNTPW